MEESKRLLEEIKDLSSLQEINGGYSVRKFVDDVKRIVGAFSGSTCCGCDPKSPSDFCKDSGTRTKHLTCADTING